MYYLIFSDKKMQLTSLRATALPKYSRSIPTSPTISIVQPLVQREKKFYKTSSKLGQARSKTEKVIQIPISFDELKRLHIEHTTWSQSQRQSSAGSSSEKFEVLKQKVLNREAS